MVLEKIFSVIESRGEERVVEIPNMGRVRGKFYRGYYAVTINGKKYIFNGAELISLDGKVIDPMLKAEILYDYPMEKLIKDFHGYVKIENIPAEKANKKTPHTGLLVASMVLSILTLYYLIVDKEVGYGLGFVSFLLSLASDIYYKRSAFYIVFSLMGAIMFGMLFFASVFS